MRQGTRRRLSLLTLTAFVLNLAPAVRTAHADPDPPPPIWGFADLHAHMFANLAYGGLAVWGKPFVPGNDMARALPWSDFAPYVEVGDVVDGNDNPAPTITLNGLPPWMHVPATCPPGTGGLFQPPCHGVSIHGLLGTDLLNFAMGGTPVHFVSGFPQFDGWPRWNNYTGQQMYHEWLQRAHDGGLRLMVMMAVNNEALCHHLTRRVEFGCEDMTAVERQLQAAQDLEAFVDDLHGGPGLGWFRIARSAAKAREIMAAGKLAVVLGIETPSLFGCKSQGDCTPEFVLAELQRFYDLGVRHVFPVHNADSGFAGTAFFNDVLALAQREINGEWWDVASCPEASGIDYHLNLLDIINDLGEYPVLSPVFAAVFNPLPPRPPAGSNCNNRGLTPLGATLVNGMMDLGMLIDVDHMSAIAFDDTLDLAGQRSYPGIISSHTGFVEMGKAGHGKRHEANKTAGQLERIRAAGGMVSTILNQGRRDEVHQYQRPDGSVPVPFVCGKSSQAWAQAYLYAVEKMGGAPVAIGSDFNGFSGVPAPRFGPNPLETCGGDRDLFYNPAAPVAYPFALHGIAGSMGRMQVAERTFDYNYDGLANVGLYPDFIQDLKNVGLTDGDLAPLFGSAEAYIRIWESANDETPPVIACGTADGAWHADNVAIDCTAVDAGSALENPADAAFTLSTSVAAGDETADAVTDSRTICDSRGNCATASPVGGNRIDRKAPAATVAAPTASVYSHSGTLTLSYSATDAGSGVATVSATMDGQPTLAGHGLDSGQAIDVLAELMPGDHAFVVDVTDVAGNLASASVTFRVAATPASTRHAVLRMLASGEIDSVIVAGLLLLRLVAAELARSIGACDAAAHHYAVFTHRVNVNTPNHITSAAAAILVADAAYLSAHCP